MTATATPASAAAARTDWRALRPFLLALLGGLACFALLFRAEIVAAVGVWIDSTAYSHCFLVLPIALWLAWDRREAARGLRPEPTFWPVLAVLPFGLAWFAAERLGLMEGRQLAVLGMLEALLVALLGPRLARAQAPALIYLVFLVPVGSFLVPTLQHFTAGFIDIGLEMLDIPHVVDSFTIEIPEGLFYVAEACAGLRFLIAAVAFGVLYGFVTYRSLGRRLGFLAASIVVPILANGVRALGIVVAGHLIGSAEAAAADHVIYGWGFFSAVIVLLALAGLPFRQDAPRSAPLPSPLPAPVPAPAPAPAGIAPAVTVAGLAAVLAALGPAAAAALNRPGPLPDLRLPGFVATAECRDQGDPPGAEQHFSCGGIPLVASVRVLPPHAPPGLLRTVRSEATGERDAADSVTSMLAIDGLGDNVPRQWRLVELHEPDRITATAAWIAGRPDPGGLAGRLQLAWDSIAGGDVPPTLVAVSLRPPSLVQADQRADAERVLRDFVRAQGALLGAIGQTVGK
jgi:exosortase A